MNPPKKSVLVISSHVIRGSVGTRASVFILEQFGFPVWSMFTVSLTWQPNHGKAHRLTVSDEDFAQWADDILRSPWLGEIGAILTGYFGSPGQVTIAARLIRALKEKNPRLVYFCDPIMGDEEGLYIDEPIAHNVKEQLLPLADIVKPNRSELEWMVGHKLDDNAMIIDAVKTLNLKNALVTSAWPFLKNSIGNLLIYENKILLAEHRAVKNPVNGLGDLTGGLFFARLLSGENAERALKSATSSVQLVLDDTLRYNADELLLERDETALKHPMAPVEMRRLDIVKARKND